MASQNISILEVGANAKVFAPFLDFLDIKTLVITDIDTTMKIEGTTKGKKTKYETSPVATSTHTSNATLKYYLNAPKDIQSTEFHKWFSELRKHLLNSIHGNVQIAYQKEEGGYHARSFEDAFISSNKENIKSNKTELMGLKKIEELDTNKNMYDLTNNILDKKSDFAASLLYLALSKDEIHWETPLYIKNGLLWIWEQ